MKEGVEGAKRHNIVTLLPSDNRVSQSNEGRPLV